MDDREIAISARGEHFYLSESLLLSHDWILSKISTSEIPFKKVNGIVQLDVDPNSLRLLLSIMQGITPFEMAVSKLSNIDLVLVQSTAQYLMCGEIESELAAIKIGHEAEIKTLQDQIEEKLNWVETLSELLSQFF